MSSPFRYVVVDVFTDTPLTGNQLAVFTDARKIPEHQLQGLAREMAFSETVFVYPPTRPEQPSETASQGALHQENDDEEELMSRGFEDLWRPNGRRNRRLDAGDKDGWQRFFSENAPP